jgi:hypothetical protein
MKRDAIKDLIYGGLSEITKNERYYYSSTVGPNYCHLTDQGKEALTEFMENMIRILRESETRELDYRAKQMVIDGLKTN